MKLAATGTCRTVFSAVQLQGSQVLCADLTAPHKSRRSCATEGFIMLRIYRNRDQRKPNILPKRRAQRIVLPVYPRIANLLHILHRTYSVL